jgi:hypothetical protein
MNIEFMVSLQFELRLNGGVYKLKYKPLIFHLIN